MANPMTTVTPVRWIGDARTGHLELLDQRLLPGEETWRVYHTFETTACAIRDMVVRGAPAIGVTAAWGVVLAAQELGSEISAEAMANPVEVLGEARPTAVNLRWALERMGRVLDASSKEDALDNVFAEAERIRAEDVATNHAIGDNGAALLEDDVRILTICNTGSLATAGYGTALGVVRSAATAGKLTRVYACETRPYLQGARLTMWELMKDGLPSTLITDSMAGHLMQRGEVDVVIAGADRIAANGDSANKIGTFSLAVLAHHHDLPFYIAAPLSTIDRACPDGAGIPIEQRSAEEVTRIKDVSIAPAGADALHPAFDVTPGQLITGIVTEKGVVEATEAGIASLFEDAV